MILTLFNDIGGLPFDAAGCGVGAPCGGKAGRREAAAAAGDCCPGLDITTFARCERLGVGTAPLTPVVRKSGASTHAACCCCALPDVLFVLTHCRLSCVSSRTQTPAGLVGRGNRPMRGPDQKMTAACAQNLAPCCLYIVYAVYRYTYMYMYTVVYIHVGVAKNDCICQPWCFSCVNFGACLH